MDKVLKYVFWVLAAGMGLLLTACAGRPEAEEFMAPELGGCVVRTDGYTATISCLISGGHDIRKSGFIFGKEGDAGQVFPVSPAMGALSMEVKGLEPGTAYAVSAFVSSGQCEVSTQPVSFAIKETDPIVRIPDEGFREYCLRNFDRNEDGVISANEAFAIKKIDLVTESISSLEGIEQFTQLEWLHVSGSGVDDGKRTGRLTTLDLRQNKNLSYVKVYGNNLKELLLPEKNSDIETIQCSANWLESLDLSGCPKLRTLYCWDNHLKEIILSDNQYLREFSCQHNELSGKMDFSENSFLTNLNCDDNHLQFLDLSSNTELIELTCTRNLLREVDLSHNTKIRVFNCDNNMLTDINVSMLSNLEDLSIGDNDISEPIDLSNFKELRSYGGNNLPLKTVPDFSHNPKLTNIHICGTGGAYFIDETFFRNFPEIEAFNIGGCTLDSIDLSLNTKMENLWIGGLTNMRIIDLSASPNLKFIQLNEDSVLETVYVHKDVDLSKLTVETDDNVHATIEHR